MLVGHVSGQVDDWQLDEDEFVASKLDRHANELDVVALLVVILEELMNGVLVVEGSEPETVELLIGILEEFATSVLEIGGNELEILGLKVVVLVELIFKALEADISVLETIELLIVKEELDTDGDWLEVINIPLDIDAKLAVIDDRKDPEENLEVDTGVEDVDDGASEEKMAVSDDARGAKALL